MASTVTNTIPGGKRIGECGLPTRREPPQTVQRPRFDDARRNLFADSPSEGFCAEATFLNKNFSHDPR